MNSEKYVLSVILAAAAIGMSYGFMNAELNAAMKVQKLNDYFLTNQTTGNPMLVIVGESINNGTATQDYVDLSLTLYDNAGEIVGTKFLYDDDVKVNDTLPFQFNVNPQEIKNADFSNVANYSVVVE